MKAVYHDDLFAKMMSQITPEMSAHDDACYQVGLNMERLMNERAITQSDIARDFDVSEDDVHDWIYGTPTMTDSIISRLSAYFNYNMLAGLGDKTW